MNKEGTSILVLPIFKDLAQLELNLGEILCDALPHLLFSEQTGGITLFALLTTSQ